MRIGMILDKTFPPDSRVENEAVSLIEAGHEVFLFCLHYGKESEFENINGIKVCRYKSNTFEYKLSALAYTVPLYTAFMKPKIKKFLVDHKIEALHVHDMAIAEAAFSANKQLKLPVVLDLHENRPAIMRHYGHVKSLKGRLLIRPDKWDKKQQEFINKADKVILVTEEAKQEALKHSKKNTGDVVVVPNTIHPDIYNHYEIKKELVNRFKDDFVVLYLGDTGLRRGTDTAIQAVNILKEQVPEIKLVLVGNNKAEDHVLKKLAKELECEAFVSFEGWQDVSLFPSYVLAASVCISPLKRNLHHDTTFANKIFQYMAMGKPLVVSDSTAQAHVVEQEGCGLVFEAENESDFADKLLEIKNSPQNANAMGMAGKKAVEEKWNWKQTSKDLLAMYNQLK